MTDALGRTDRQGVTFIVGRSSNVVEEMPVCRMATVVPFVMALLAGCRNGPTRDDLSSIQLLPDYSREEFLLDLRAVRQSKWPCRELCDAALLRAAKKVNWEGLSRDAVLRMLGPADGEVDYETVDSLTRSEVDGKIVELVIPVAYARLKEPTNDRLIYRIGDGHNKGYTVTFYFDKGVVSKVEVGFGY